MKKLSLRWRLTLVTVMVLTAICAVSTAYSIINANRMITPVNSEVELIGVCVQDFSDYADSVIAISGTFVTDDLESGGEPYPFFTESRSGSFRPDDTWDGELNIILNEHDAAGLQTIVFEVASSVAEQSYTLMNYVETTTVTLSNAQRSFNYSSLIFMAILIIFGGILVYFASGYALKPVQTLINDIRAINGEQLSLRVDTGPAADEIGNLAGSFNNMLERLEHSFSAQKRFSTAAAHELKTPLAAIHTNIDVLKMDENPTPEDYAELMDVVTRQTERMCRLVDDLFAMSSLQECNMDDVIELDDTLNSITRELTPVAEKKEITLTLDSHRAILLGNQVIFSRAVSNLVENAIRYTPPGGSVEVCCKIEGDKLLIIVADTGPGIPEEHLQDIFDPFYRIDPSRSRKLGGAGIGLAIASEIIALHNGRVEAANRDDGGSVFTVSLPCD